ncbi:hypothetical protein JO972_08460 [Verrucomicrobiaceae bacterium 5K15]|uniref:Uncharacterized protein n=1 Tax=Oceaniferula flava TaxID=2800421 RepID=A0AAE2SBZ9_9BACT|nr:hypothetical protein [Oceaniferula flavus]MBK1854989.1 hypothetical protein [Oceaniferula flavus]MBM1136295.1 hypothetical protein [Oceaniferula flavus]
MKMSLKKSTVQEHLLKTLQPHLHPQWRGQLQQQSPWQIYEKRAAKHEFLRCMFPMDALIWLGRVHQSGQQKYSKQFRRVYDWLQRPLLPARCAAGIFLPGGYARSIANIKSAPFIVVESDDLLGRSPLTSSEREANKAWSYALIQYLVEAWGLSLRAVIDTGNKSLHAWFDRPNQHTLNCIIHLAESHHIDKQILLYGHAAPLRMPGCIHEKTKQPAELLYLKSYSQITH